MARKHEDDYFRTFIELEAYSCKAAKLLQEVLENYDGNLVEEKMVEMHEIEHTADIEKHIMMKRLAREFITPIEREDIIDMAHQIDDVTDAIEDVLMRLYMFNIKNIRREALEFTKVIVRCCEALKEALEEFHNFRKSKTLNDLLVEVNHLEEEGDKLYTDAMRRLCVESTDAVEITVWKETFDRLEKCCDECENVADVIESVMMKNS